MSIVAMVFVWEESPFEGGALLVHLALADYANDLGQCWPSTETLARRARLSTRQVNRVLKELQDAGEIMLNRGGTKERSAENPITLRQNVSGQNVRDADVPTSESPASPSRARPNGVEPSVEEPSFAGELFQVEETPTDRQLLAAHWTTRSGRELRLDRTTTLLLDQALKVRPLEVCKQAIDGLFTDPWWRDNRPKLELRYALRGNHGKGETDADRIDKMAAKVAEGANAGTTVDSLISHLSSDGQRMVRAWMRDVEAAVRNPGNPGVRLTGDSATRQLAERAKLKPITEGLEVVRWERIED